MAKYTQEEILFNKIERKMRKAMVDYRLIEDGDKILIGLSGGKDSLALVDLLGRRQKILKPKFKVIAVHISMSRSEARRVGKGCRIGCRSVG